MLSFSGFALLFLITEGAERSRFCLCGFVFIHSLQEPYTCWRRRRAASTRGGRAAAALAIAVWVRRERRFGVSNDPLSSSLICEKLGRGVHGTERGRAHQSGTARADRARTRVLPL